MRNTMKHVISAVALVFFLCLSALAADIKPALVETFGNEGGYCVDSGGPTKYGICQRSYPKENIKALTLERAAYLYKRDFWGQLLLDDAKNQLVANEVFDGAVNMGEPFEARLLQEAYNLANGHQKDIPVNGVLTHQTWKLINQADQLVLYVNLIGLRYDRYKFIAQRNPKQEQYFEGWLKRVAKNVTKAVHELDARKGKR